MATVFAVNGSQKKAMYCKETQNYFPAGGIETELRS